MQFKAVATTESHFNDALVKHLAEAIGSSLAQVEQAPHYRTQITLTIEADNAIEASRQALQILTGFDIHDINVTPAEGADEITALKTWNWSDADPDAQ